VTKRILALIFAAFASLLILDLLVWHPGYSFFDEGLSLAYVQQYFEGQALPLELFKGCLHRDAVAMGMALLGKNLETWRLLTLGALGLESLLLLELGKRWIGERAGLWAAGFNLCCALTFLRARSLLAYTVLPLELLFLLWLLPRARSGWASLLWGSATALALCDYEGWIFALPVLALAWFLAAGSQRPRALPAASGFVAVAVFFLLLSRTSLASHLVLRQRSLPQGLGSLASVIWSSLKSFFWGGDTFGYMGIAGHSVYPFWALPLLALGLVSAWARQRWWLAWLLIGFLPMALIGTAAEPNRLMVAWPALCLISGLGLARLPEKLWPGLLLALGLGACLEGRAYVLSMRAQYGKYYSESVELMRMARQSKQDYPEGARLISELDYESSAPARFLWGAYGPPKDGKTQAQALALVPWEYAVALGPVQADAGPRQAFILIKPSPAEAGRLEGLEAELLALRKTLPRFDFVGKRQRMMDYLSEHPKADPWLRSALVESSLGLSFMIGEIPPQLLQTVLREKLASASAYEWLAYKAGAADPKLARYLCLRALQQDPRRVELKELLAGLPGPP
jgi:hypothetical protein